jgi:hypothetical protein
MADELSWRDFVEVDVFEQNRQNLARIFSGLSNRDWYPSADEMPIIKNKMASLIDASLVIHSTTQKGVLGICRDGSLRSSRQLNNRGTEHESTLTAIEAFLFGNTAGKPTVIYGALSDARVATGPHYGDVQIVLRPNVKNRCTVTRGDTGNTFGKVNFNFEAAFMIALPLEEIDPLLLLGTSVKNLTNIALTKIDDLLGYDTDNGTTLYLEVQIHGGVTSTDILRIEAPSDIIKDEEIQQWANFYGILLETR